MDNKKTFNKDIPLWENKNGGYRMGRVTLTQEHVARIEEGGQLTIFPNNTRKGETSPHAWAKISTKSEVEQFKASLNAPKVPPNYTEADGL